MLEGTEIELAQNPEVVSAKNEATTLCEKARTFQIQGQEDLQEAADAIGWIKKTTAKIEGLRTKFVKPLNDHVKMINAFFKEATNPLDEADKIIRGKMTVWQTAQDKICRDEEARLQKEQDDLRAAQEAERKKQLEAAKKNDGPPPPPLPPPPPPIQIAPAPKIEGMKTRKQIRWEITDAKLLPREYLMPDEKKIAAASKIGIMINGVRVWEELIPVSVG